MMPLLWMHANWQTEHGKMLKARCGHPSTSLRCAQDERGLGLRRYAQDERSLGLRRYAQEEWGIGCGRRLHDRVLVPPAGVELSARMCSVAWSTQGLPHMERIIGRVGAI
jgi:hypothetical protein